MVGPPAAGLTPMVFQEMWSDLRGRREDWAGQDGYAPRPDMFVIWWRGPTNIICGGCHEPIIDVMTYCLDGGHRPEYGVVADTSDPVEMGPKGSRTRRFWPDKHVGGRSGRATVSFRCPGCHRRDLERNMRKLGLQLFQERPEALTLG